MVNKPKAVVCDIDDCILPFITHLCNFHNRMHKTEFKRGDITEWELPDELMKTFKDFESWLYICQPVFPKAKKRIDEFIKQGYKILLLTARPQKFEKHTKFNLTFNDINYSEVYFNKNKALKLNRLSDKYDIKYFIDDRLETINRVRKETDVPNVYLINMPSNKYEDIEEGVKRINSISDIEEK